MSNSSSKILSLEDKTTNLLSMIADESNSIRELVESIHVDPAEFEAFLRDVGWEDHEAARTIQSLSLKVGRGRGSRDEMATVRSQEKGMGLHYTAGTHLASQSPTVDLDYSLGSHKGFEIRERIFESLANEVRSAVAQGYIENTELEGQLRVLLKGDSEAVAGLFEELTQYGEQLARSQELRAAMMFFQFLFNVLHGSGLHGFRAVCTVMMAEIAESMGHILTARSYYVVTLREAIAAENSFFADIAVEGLAGQADALDSFSLLFRRGRW